ncbi:MAG TPA: peptidoglycan-binding protein [Methyloceanibacter sp.]|nr:peptidoglycan-binding protein [Methyloceanibacter sp.]
MASEASWQTSGAGQGSNAMHDGEPMDQRTVESLLRRLVERVEDSERRYGEALDELHARLDQLSQTTEAARETGAPDEADTFDRLHSQVSDLARRLESEASTPLDDFERLGKALAGGLRADADESPFEYEPEPSPFAQATMHAPSHLAPASAFPDFSYAPEPGYENRSGAEPFAAEQANLDKRLVDMAERLEQSIGAAMPTGAIEALNARLDEIGSQLGQTLEKAPSREALEQVERQISDMGQQLGRAEEQLSKVSGVEAHLLKLIERLDAKDSAQTPAQVDPAQLQEIATKAATEAARLVADDSKKTTERLDAMHHELTAMGDKSRESNDRLVTTLKSVHDSLKQLVQQFEQDGPSLGTRPRAPFADRARQAEAKPASPFAQATAGQTQAPKMAAPQTPQAPAPKMPEQDAKPSPRRPEMGAEIPTKESLRDRLGAAIPDFKESETPPPFGRAKRSGEEAVDLDAAMPRSPRVRVPLGTDMPTQDEEAGAPDDLVTAARRAAKAAATRAEERDGRRPRARVTSTDLNAEQPGRRKRSLLIISAATLLVISAILLYGRLGSKPTTDVTPATSGETMPEVAPETVPMDGDMTAPDATETAPTADPDQSGSLMILPDPGMTPGPDFAPFNGRVGQSMPGVTDVAKSSGLSSGLAMPASELNPQPQLAALKPTNDTTLPPGVIFSIEDPSSAADVATAEKLTSVAVKAPMPPKALGSLALRKAASEGDGAAQYTIALRYMEGKGTKSDPKKASEWLDRAARTGLAPAQYRLAAMYERGVGVEQDTDKARGWYMAAAERGNVKAMHNLAVSVSGRDGSAPDYTLAAKWYGEAAARGLPDSQFNLGILAEHGLGMTKNLSQAYQWFALAAAQGDPEARKRREVIRVQLAPETLAQAEAAVTAWTAMPAVPEANQVAESPAWVAQAPAKKATTLVSRAQTLLNKLGYDVGAPDGMVGPRTRTAIKTFQERNGLDQTGDVSLPLVDKLEHLSS